MRKLTFDELLAKAKLNVQKEVNKNPKRVFAVSAAGIEYTAADWLKSLQTQSGIGFEAIQNFWIFNQPDENFEFVEMPDEEDLSDFIDLI